MIRVADEDERVVIIMVLKMSKKEEVLVLRGCKSPPMNVEKNDERIDYDEDVAERGSVESQGFEGGVSYC